MKFPAIEMTILFIFGNIIATKVSDDELANRFHDLGINAAMVNDYVVSIPYLRAACRLKPTDQYFWNDLGVTEMRMGEYRKAIKRFQKTLEIQKDYKVALDNLNELKKFVPKDEYDHILKTEKVQLHRVSDVKYVDPYDGVFDIMDGYVSIANYDALLEPFVVKQALLHWRWNLDAINTKELIKSYGNTIVDYYPQNMLDERIFPFRAPLTKVLGNISRPQEIYSNVDASEPGTYIHWNIGYSEWHNLISKMNGIIPTLFDDTFWLSQCFENNEMINLFHYNTRWKMVLIGEAGASMFNHKDAMKGASVQFQIKGRKKWHICPPDQERYMNFGHIDMFNPDYERHPELKKAECYQFITEPGDVVFYPKNHWHQVLNLDTPTIAFTATLATPDNYRDITEKLNNECLGNTAGMFNPFPIFCHQLSKCFKYWNETFHPLKRRYYASTESYCNTHDCDIFTEPDDRELYFTIPKSYMDYFDESLDKYLYHDVDNSDSYIDNEYDDDDIETTYTNVVDSSNERAYSLLRQGELINLEEEYHIRLHYERSGVTEPYDEFLFRNKFIVERDDGLSYTSVEIAAKLTAAAAAAAASAPKEKFYPTKTQVILESPDQPKISKAGTAKTKTATTTKSSKSSGTRPARKEGISHEDSSKSKTTTKAAKKLGSKIDR